MSQPRDPAVATHSFQQFIGNVEDGQLQADLSQALQRLLADMRTHQVNVGGNPKGKIAIAFDFKLENGVVEVSGNYSVTAPKRVGGKSIYWVTDDGHLTGRNPKQMDMLRDVSGSHAMRTV